MNIIQTKSFQIAIYAAGNPNSKNVALVLPGRLDTKDYVHMRKHVEYLASLGYYALSFDPPGTWESPGDINLYSSENYLQSVHEIIDYLGDRKILLVGHSRGGNMAMLAAVANKSVTGFVALMASALPPEPDDEWRKLGVKTFLRDMPPGNSPTVNKKTFELPYTLFKGANNLLSDLQTCFKPKLFVAGIQDTQNTPELIKIGFEASAEPKKLYMLNTGHGYRYQEDAIDEVNGVIGDFVQSFDLSKAAL